MTRAVVALATALPASDALCQAMYITSGTQGIVELNAQGVAIPFATLPANASGHGLAFDSAGNLYAADFNLDQITEITPSGATSLFATLPSNSQPWGLAFKSGNLFVSNNFTNVINEVTPSGAVSVYATLPGGAHGVAFSDNGTGALLTASYFNDQLNWAVPPLPNVITAVTLPANSSPDGIAFDQGANVYIAEAKGDRIDKYSMDTGVLTTFATLPTGSNPHGIAFDGSGNLFVADLGTNAITKISADGSSVATFATVASPRAIAFGPATPPVPIPTQTPAIQAFPSPSTIYSTLPAFVQAHGPEFSPDSQQFLVANSTPDFVNGAQSWKTTATAYGQFLEGGGQLVNLMMIGKDPAGDLTGAIAALPFIPKQLQTAGQIGTIGSSLAFDIATQAGPQALYYDLIAANAYIYGDWVGPELVEFAKDPIDPNYTLPVTLSLSPQPIKLTSPTPLAQSLAQAYLDQENTGNYLTAANTAYNRYCTALANGDAKSAALQLESLLYYMQLFRKAAAASAADLSQVNALLASDPIAGTTYDPSSLANLQASIEANGLPASTVSFLQGVGLSSDDIDQTAQNLLALDPNAYSGNLTDQLSQTQTDFTEVPEPSTFMVLLSALMLFLGRKRATRSA